MRYVGMALLFAAPSAFSFTPTATPSFGLEPSSIALLIGGIVGVVVLRVLDK